jgi:hypothetical protein
MPPRAPSSSFRPTEHVGQVQRADIDDIREGRWESGEHGAAASIAGDSASLCMASEAEEREW